MDIWNEWLGGQSSGSLAIPDVGDLEQSTKYLDTYLGARVHCIYNYLGGNISLQMTFEAPGNNRRQRY